MMPNVTTPTFSRPDLTAPVPAWSLYGDGHVIAAAIVKDVVKNAVTIEAQILLDGTLLYRSRHATWASAAEELVALRGHWAREGWIEAS